MSSLAKLSGPDLDRDFEFTYPNVFEREDFPGWSRLRIGAREREIPLILELTRDFAGPFGVLYVSLVSRMGFASGRYQNPEPISYEDLELFLYNFQEFLEQFDREEEALMQYWQWKHFPLRPDDDP